MSEEMKLPCYHMSYEEAMNQEVFSTGDGEFFDYLDEKFGIKPGTDELIEDQDNQENENE